MAGGAAAQASKFHMNPTVFVVGGRITPRDIPGLCCRLRRLLLSTPIDIVACDVGALVDADGVAVDALARLQLTAGRFATRLLLCQVSTELEELLTLSGLDAIVGSAS